MSTPNPSYHDVTVFINGEKYKITDDYAYLLQCTRSGGWSLWCKWNGNEMNIGSEYGDTAFRIEVRGVVVCDNGIAMNRDRGAK